MSTELLYEWKADGPGSSAGGVCGELPQAQAALRARMRSAMVREGKVAEVRLLFRPSGRCGQVSYYEPTGRAWRAVLTSNGRVLFYPVRPAGPGPVTGRELEIAQLAVQGLTSAQIAGKLTLARATVDCHLRHVYAKAGISGRGARARLAAWLGTVQGPAGR